MARINLLPWRDELRQEKKKEFITVLIGFCVLGLLCGYVWVSTVQASIDNQMSRNNRLQKEITALEAQVAEIKDLRKRKEELLARMKVIQDLQYTRPVIVHYFDEIVRAVPKGVYLTTLKRSGNTITIEGAAESYNRISSLLRNLDGSEWFDGATMSTIDEQEDKESGTAIQRFRMTITTTVPKDQQEENS